VKRISLVLVFILFSLSLFFIACTKIDTTTLGADLIPAVDNIHTFELILDVESNNILFDDSTRMLSTDDLPIGYTNDPEFGQTKADLYFDIAIPNNKTYPFGKKDSLVTDSVILSLAFRNNYGDTNTSQTFRVFEISQTSGFEGDSLYRLDNPDFATTGGELGNRTFAVNSLNDSVHVIRKDTTKVVNVLRIPLDPALGTRLMGYDTTFSANGGYYNDSLFKTLLRGFAIKTDQVGNALTYFNVADVNTKLIVYYRYGKTDTSEVEFRHSLQGIQNLLGVASTVKRTAGGGWNTYLNNGNPEDDLLYLPTTPGSYGLLKIKGLDTVTNKAIHLAELIVPKIPSAQEDKYPPQPQIFLDMINKTNDTVFTIQNDFVLSNFGYNFEQFGGFLLSHAGNQEYRFNISRHVQGIVTRKEPNFDLRVYAPFETNIYYLPPGPLASRKFTNRVNIPIVPRVALGRVVVGGGNNAIPANKLRLRIVYSKI
jgi:Domain of unknown function (DUF4270)